MTRHLTIGPLALLLLTLPQALEAQDAGLRLAAVGCRARETVMLLRAKEQAWGWCTGGVVTLKLGPLVFEGSGFRAGRMEATLGPPVSRDAGEVRGIGAIAPVPWVALEGGYIVRAFSSAFGYQRWQVPSGGIKLAAPLGNRSLIAHLRGHYLAPSDQRIFAGQRSATVRWDLGLSVESGLTIAPRKVPLFFGASYRLERYDFPGEGAGRLEQFELLTLFGGIRLGA